MPPDRDNVYLWDMLKTAQGVASSLQGLTSAQYPADENLRWATEEDRDHRRRRPPHLTGAQGSPSGDPLAIDRRSAHVLIHAYDEVETERIWALAQRDIPRQLEQLAVGIAGWTRSWPGQNRLPTRSASAKTIPLRLAPGRALARGALRRHPTKQAPAADDKPPASRN
jgi:uncharacterized protein with HEPN domain